MRGQNGKTRSKQHERKAKRRVGRERDACPESTGFPARKSDLLDLATKNHAERAVLEVVAPMPDQDYRNMGCDEDWLEQHRYLNMDDLREHKKEALRSAA
ncbi:MAG: DUF2795 domain-containing protein [Alphaproteobacteria bacterium]|nr:MAG: DUF2795 domain-containing protein [Alphaproteobacteria bacterium]